jgi:hypothetical protein
MCLWIKDVYLDVEIGQLIGGSLSASPMNRSG